MTYGLYTSIVMSMLYLYFFIGERSKQWSYKRRCKLWIKLCLIHESERTVLYHRLDGIIYRSMIKNYSSWSCVVDNELCTLHLENFISSHCMILSMRVNIQFNIYAIRWTNKYWPFYFQLLTLRKKTIRTNTMLFCYNRLWKPTSLYRESFDSSYKSVTKILLK